LERADYYLSELIFNATNTFLEFGVNNVVVSTDPSVAEAIGKSGNEISQVLLKLFSALDDSSGITPAQGLFGIFIAFFGAFSAFFFNYLHWRMVEKKKKVSNICLTVIQLLNDLEEMALDYWTKNYNSAEKEKIHIQEITIKSNIFLFSKYIRLLSSQINTNKSSNNVSLESSLDDIFDLITGDDFESTTRAESKPKAFKIAKELSAIKAMIFSLRMSEE